jgi:flagellar biogenesis protein FliO
MSARTIDAPPATFAERSPLAQHLRNAMRALAKRFAQTASSAERALAVEDRVTIGPKKSLVVVRCHGRRFLVATTIDSIGPILEIAAPKTGRRARAERKA